MRTLLFSVVLAGAVAIGYLSAPRASAQETVFGPAGVAQGEKIRVILDTDRLWHECTVIDVRGDFLGCRIERQPIGESGYTRWYNLRLVVRIDRPSRQ